MTLLHTIPAPEPGVPGTGLLRSATVITHNTNGELATAIGDDGLAHDNHEVGADEMRWGNGLVFSPYSCDNAAVVDPCAADNTGMSTAATRPTPRSYLPFIVDAHDKCSTFGWEAADYEQRARRLMAARESKAVAREFWVAERIGTNPHLASGGSVTTVGVAVSPRSGLALLCQAVADENGGAGMIHCRPYLLQYWASIGAVRFENSKWFTATGVAVVGDAGYPGTGPTGQAVTNTLGAITEWAYATDLVEVHRGPVDVMAEPLSYQSVDYQTNVEIVRAQRLYAPIWNGCALAAVSITTPAADE